MLAAPPRLRLVPALPADDAPHLTVPVPRGGDAGSAGPWHTEGDLAFVPAVLLLAASGRCSCDDCCEALVRDRRAARLTAL